jgi:hypothetical protein
MYVFSTEFYMYVFSTEFYMYVFSTEFYMYVFSTEEVLGSIPSLRGDSECVLTIGHSNINPC